MLGILNPGQNDSPNFMLPQQRPETHLMRGDGKEILTHVEDETRTDAAEANMLKMKEKQDTSHSKLAWIRSLKVNMFTK